jgi:hypothetical protein
MRQTGADAAKATAAQAKAAQQLANDAIAAAQRELNGAQTATGKVRVEEGAAGITISIPDEDGDPQVIVLSRDGHQIKSVENMNVSAIVPRRQPNELPKTVMVTGLFAIAAGVMILSPLMRALARVIDRRGTAPAMSNDSAQRLAAIEQAVEAVAVEVERISEGQRFTAKLLSDRAKAAVEVR